LNPKIACSGRISTLARILSTNFHHRLLVVRLNVVVQELLFEPKSLTAFLNAFREIVDLKEEENIILINLLIVLANELSDLVLE